MSLFFKKTTLITPEQALPGRAMVMAISGIHSVTGNAIIPPFPEHLQQIILGLGCFWGAERKFWQLNGVFSTAVGYAGGYTPNPTYQEVCSGNTGHTEAVLVVFDANILSLQQLLTVFWESHNPTQGMRQGNDIGSQYRSAIYTFTDDQYAMAVASQQHYQQLLKTAGYGEITTEIKAAGQFYYAEEYHQQYLAKNPDGYCGLGGLGVRC